jgi:hypothetical protein
VYLLSGDANIPLLGGAVRAKNAHGKIRGSPSEGVRNVSRCFDVHDFRYQASEYPVLVGKVFQVVLIEDDPLHLPFVCRWDGDKIRKAAIYIRRGTSTEEANYNELQEIINRRIETGYSSQGEIELQKHLYDLSALYTSIQSYHSQTADVLSRAVRKLDPNYPREDFDEFIAKAIQKKKRLIEKILGFSER